MQIRILAPALVNGIWHEPGVGNYEPGLAQHLIDLGVAEVYETKVVEPTEFKVDKPKKITGSLQQGQASPAVTPKKRGRPRKKKAES